MYLELADNYSVDALPQRAPFLSQDAITAATNNTRNAYLRIPQEDGTFKFVREDLFDDLTDAEWSTFWAQIEPYQNQDMSLLGIGKKARARRETRLEAKGVRREKKDVAKQKRIEARQASGGILGKIGGIVGMVTGAGQPPPEAAAPTGAMVVAPAVTGMSMTTKVMIGGAAFLLIGGILYMVSKGKNAKPQPRPNY